MFRLTTKDRLAPILKARRCLILCELSMASACTRVIYRVILPRTAASACLSSWRKTSSNCFARNAGHYYQLIPPACWVERLGLGFFEVRELSANIRRGKISRSPDAFRRFRADRAQTARDREWEAAGF